MTTRIHRAAFAVTAGATVLAAVAGCGDTAVPAAGNPDHAEHRNTEHTGHGAAGTHHGGGGLTLWAVQKSGGTVLVTDEDGRPFYRSNADGSGPARPACTGACTLEWKPVTVDGGQWPELLGVARSAVGIVRRADGAAQLTLGGAPLYRRAGRAQAQPDPKEFTARGWHAVTPRGERVTG